MYATTTTDISEAVKVIKDGRIVAFPTGTSYGLAVNTLSGHSLQRLRNVKKRPAEKAFSVFMAEPLYDTYLDLSQEERELLTQYAHAALTLLVHPKEPLAHIAQDGLVGLRMIDHPLMEQFAEAAALPLTATSANITGQEPCYKARDIEKALPAKDGTTYDLSLGCILDGGDLQPGLISTVAKFKNGKFSIVRQGSLILLP